MNTHPRSWPARYLAGVGALVASSVIHAQALDPVESRLAAAIERDSQWSLALLERVVNINSGTMNFAGVRAVGEVFRLELDALGFDSRWIDGAPFKRAGHLVARREGRGPKVLLIGHLDTVFEKDSAFQRFERISEFEARGPGIIDMKGGNVIIVSALRALRTIAALDAAEFTVVLTGDEEDMGDPPELARRDLIDAAADARIALAFENGSGDPRRAVIARRGTTSWELRVRGQPAHSSQIFTDTVGAGAIYEASRVLTEFYRQLSGDPLLTFNPGAVLGGTSVEFDPTHARGTAFGKTNVVAEHAIVAGDLRTISREQLDSAKQVMSRIAAGGLPRTTTSLTFTDGYPAMAATPGNERLLALYDQVSRDLGTGPVTATDPRDAGAADVSFVAGRMEMALDGIGLMGRDSHTSLETADLRTLLTQTQRAATLIHRLSR